MRKLFAAAMVIGLLALFGLTVSAADIEDGFVSLFNGRDLAGWVKRGGVGGIPSRERLDRREMRSQYAGQHVPVFGKGIWQLHSEAAIQVP